MNVKAQPKMKFKLKQVTDLENEVLSIMFAKSCFSRLQYPYMEQIAEKISIKKKICATPESNQLRNARHNSIFERTAISDAQ